MAPDGEIISVGGSIGPFRSHDVGIISDVTLPQARDGEKVMCVYLFSVLSAI